MTNLAFFWYIRIYLLSNNNPFHPEIVFAATSSSTTVKTSSESLNAAEVVEVQMSGKSYSPLILYI